MRRPWLVLLACVLVAVLGGTPATAAERFAATAVPHYDHIFVIVEENHGFTDVIGNPAAPNLNALADKFGLATNYFGISHPSEPNYVALLGGNSFGIQDDNPYFLNTVDKPSLIIQLDHAGISWKAYLQSLPYPGYRGICYPAKCNGSPDIDPLYVSKHDGIQNYTTSRNARDWSLQVPIEQLKEDLASGHVPAFGWIIPDECTDEHGDPPYCLDSGNPFDPQDQHLVAFGDAYLGSLVASITGATFWSHGNNAIAVIYDEGDDNAGCCDAAPGGGQVASIIITSHGPRGVKDPTAYNHYSLLQTIQQSFGLDCLEHTCDTANVKSMTPLFAVTGSQAVRTTALDVPNFATPSPTPDEPVSFTKHTESSGGWTVVSSPLRGTNDNSLGAIAASAPNDIWAVGNFVPDTPTSNQDATLSLAVHFDGTSWSVTPTPNTGPNFNTFFAAAAAGGRAWGVGVHLNSNFQTRGLIESWDAASHKWTIDDVPQPGPLRDLLFGAAALSPSDAWAVGEQQAANGTFGTLILHWNGSAWSAVSGANPGATGNHLYAVAGREEDDVWAVGQRNGATWPDAELIEHWDGSRWTSVSAPDHSGASAALYAVSVDRDGGVWAAGETIDASRGGQPLLEHLQDGQWRTVNLPGVGSPWSTLWGVSASEGHVTPLGVFMNLATGNVHTLVLSGADSPFQVVNAPNPGAGDNVLSGIALAGETEWAMGHYKDNGPRQTLIMRHQL